MSYTNTASKLGIDLSALQGVTQDSRVVDDGYLFAALQGEECDGHDYIPDAIERGAGVILGHSNCSSDFDGAFFVGSDNPRKDFSHITAEYFVDQPKYIVAVTGTNGKSSVVHFANQLWNALGERSTYIGTLNTALTTPDSVSLFKALAKMTQDGITHVAIEASSHGLAQYRMDGAQISVAAFTTFSQDHLDYHNDMQSYFEAKTRLFEELLPISGTAVLNADIAEYQTLQAICKKRGLKILSYGLNADDILLRSCRVDGIKQKLSLDIHGRLFDITIPLVGEFQVMNVLCALACVIAEDQSDEARINVLIDTIARIEPVPGRLQYVSDQQGKYHAYVDYAHTPDALKTVLNAIRPHVSGRLITVFGCGGDRDQTKRALMGGIAAQLSDHVIVTDDNPRTENPADIRDHILSGILTGSVAFDIVEERCNAIHHVVQMMEEGDVVIVAGKGHEQGQVIGSETLPFDDAKELQNAFLTKVDTSN